MSADLNDETMAADDAEEPARTTNGLDRMLTLEIARVTEGAAVAAARFRGLGDEESADRAAVDAMRRELNKLPIDGTVVIGEGEQDEAPKLYIGERVGAGAGPKVDIAVVPLESSTICAKALPGSLSVIGMAEAGSLLNAPDVYMEKIAIGPGYDPGLVDLDASPEDNIRAVAKAKGVPVEEIMACILDRPRHRNLIEAVRRAGAAIHLIGDGDIASVILTTEPEETGIDIYMGMGGAPEGVLAAAALRCIGGQIQARLRPLSETHRRRAMAFGIEDFDRKYTITDLAKGDVIFAATGVTDGSLLDGVKFGPESLTTESIVMRTATHTVRWIKTEHRALEKFA